MSCAALSTRRSVVRGWHVIVLAWLLAFATRPLVLGFYDDDWTGLLLPAQTTGAFSWARFAFAMNLYANRPLSGLITYVLSSVCGESPMLFHGVISLMALGTALMLRAFLRSLLRLSGRNWEWAAVLGAALWLTFPWALGSIARPASSPNLAAVFFFALAGKMLFDRWRRGEAAWLAPAVFFLLNCLAYEALYGQFVVLFVIGWFCGAPHKIGVKRFAAAAGGFAGAQALAIVWNRLVPLFTAFAPSKHFCPVWFGVLIDNLSRLRYFIGHSAREVSPLVELALLAVLGLGGAVLGWTLIRRNTRRRSRRGLGVLAACGLGVLIGLAVLSVADYRLKGVGLGSRTTMAVSFWLAAALAVTLGSLPARPFGVRLIGTCGTVVLGGLLTLATQTRIGEWAEAWEMEQEILASAPLDELAAADPGAVVLYMGPERHKGVRVFGYMNNIDYAMRYTYPHLADLRFHPAVREDWITTWDGTHFEQRAREAPAWESRQVWNQSDTSEVWVWLRETGEAFRVEPPFEFTTDSSYPWPYESVACPWPYDPRGR